MSDRILIFGNDNGGTSSLARSLAHEHMLTHLDLGIPVAQDAALLATPARSRIEIEQFIDTNAGWVIEGAHADLLALLMDECSELLFLSPGVDDARAVRTREHDHALATQRWLFDRFNGVKREFATLD